MVNLRLPLQDPLYPKQDHFAIQFCHPGYHKKNVLFSLWATDQTASGTSSLYARFALDACAIVAANRHDGWLSTDQNINDARINKVEAGSMLRDRKYYYHLNPLPEDEEGEPYKVVPNFEEWEFPHDAMPPHWQAMAVNRTAPNSARSRSNLSDALRSQDKACRLSRCREKLNASHLVPQTELAWFERNGMATYNNNQSIVNMDDVANAILLRVDLHLAFDGPKFTFVPKGEGNDAQLVCHLVDTSEELVHLYHNRALPPSSVSIEMLYARLAWTIFHFLGAFLQGQDDRRLATTVETTKANSRGFVPASECKGFFKSNKGRPKKRNKGAPSTSVDEADADIATNTATAANTPITRCRRRKFASTTDHEIVRNPHRRRDTEPSLIHETHSSMSAESNSPPSPQRHIEYLRLTWLEAERQRSDQAGVSKQESEFVNEVWSGKPISGDEVNQFYLGCGVEVQDSFEEE